MKLTVAVLAAASGFCAMAQSPEAALGRKIFSDPSLSASGRMSCATCHRPDHAYGPPNDAPVMLGGPNLTLPGTRAVPSLTYLERQPEFSIGPDDPFNENVNLTQQSEIGKTAVPVNVCRGFVANTRLSQGPRPSALGPRFREDDTELVS